MNDNQIPLLVCCDSNMLQGLCVTLFSSIVRATRPLKIYLLHNGLSAGELSTVVNCCRSAKKVFSLTDILVDDTQFSTFRPLVGNRFAYARLLMGDMVPESRVIYLDSDLLVMLDLAELYDEPIDGFMLGAGLVELAQYALEKEFFSQLGIPAETETFNSGVMLLDLDLWRREKMKERCFEFGANHSTELKAADQTILNGVLRGSFFRLSDRYNRPLYACAKPSGALENSIYHFIGSPKPWDPFGSYVHGHYAAYARALQDAGLSPWPVQLRKIPALAARVFRLSKSYLRCIRS